MSFTRNKHREKELEEGEKPFFHPFLISQKR